MTWVLDHSRSRHGARLVLLAIAYHGETASVGVGELMTMTRLGKRAVQAAIRDLMALEELAVDFRPGEASHYRVLMADREPLPVPVPVKRDEVPDETRFLVFERDGYRCAKCGSGEDPTIDHIHPQSLGGDHSEGNLQTLCRSCNSRKGARVLWRALRRGSSRPSGPTRISCRSPATRKGCTCSCCHSGN